MTTRERVIEILEACGADPSQWPAGEREAVARALAEDADLQVLADEARSLDGWMKDWEALPPCQQAMDALFAAVDSTPQITGRAQAWTAPARRWNGWLAGGGAVALAAGIVAALMMAGQPTTKAPVEVTDSAVIAMAFSAEQSEGWL